MHVWWNEKEEDGHTFSLLTASSCRQLSAPDVTAAIAVPNYVCLRREREITKKKATATAERKTMKLGAFGHSVMDGGSESLLADSILLPCWQGEKQNWRERENQGHQNLWPIIFLPFTHCLGGGKFFVSRRNHESIKSWEMSGGCKNWNLKESKIRPVTALFFAPFF